jgi:hypothetical protein
MVYHAESPKCTDMVLFINLCKSKESEIISTSRGWQMYSPSLSSCQVGPGPGWSPDPLLSPLSLVKII